MPILDQQENSPTFIPWWLR